MKKLLTGIIAFISIITVSIAAGAWTLGTFEIHMLDVGQRMAQLVIAPNSNTLLIDCFEHNWNSSKCAEKVVVDIERITGGKHYTVNDRLFTTYENSELSGLGVLGL